MRDAQSRGRPMHWQLIGGGLAAGGVALFGLANAHLVSVALSAQPECVAHVESSLDAQRYSAARSSC
jgi:hypothetical protein